MENEEERWKKFFDENIDLPFIQDLQHKGTFRVYKAGISGPIIFFLHGGGHTSLSWALVTCELKNSMRIIAYDSRGHGETKCEDEYNMYADILVNDGLYIIENICNSIKQSNNNILPPVILVGHSLGGAIAIRIAASGKVENLQGLIVVDVVEGTAIEALPGMANFVRKIPKSFKSIEEGIHWSLKSNSILNKNSAYISIPSQLIKNNDLWEWRCDLAKTQPFWEDWFRGISKLFLQSKCTKVLILAGQERLDKELMIAHMQGKFQLHIIQHSGHAIEEDQPGQVAKVIMDFVCRYKLDKTSFAEAR